MKFDKSKVCVAGLHDVPVGTKGYCANTMAKLESTVITENEYNVCTIYDTQGGYYFVRGRDYNFDGVMFYPAPEKQYRPFETIEEAQVMKGKWIRSKDYTEFFMAINIRVDVLSGLLLINGYTTESLCNEFIVDETGEPVGVEV